MNTDSLVATRTSLGKVPLVHLATGQRLVRWPVDARELLATEQYAVVEPDEVIAEEGSVLPPPTVSAAITPHGLPVVVRGASPAVAGAMRLTHSSPRRGLR